jgi:hypothetical protein
MQLAVAILLVIVYLRLTQALIGVFPGGGVIIWMVLRPGTDDGGHGMLGLHDLRLLAAAMGGCTALRIRFPKRFRQSVPG